MLPKPQKDLLLPSNYRPITLLNVDYKIIASAINNRMKSHLNTLIKPGQNGFIKGRHIGDNIRLLFDVIDFADLNDTLGAVLAVDIFKAFDSLKWEFIYQVLEKYGFGSSILHWIKTLYAQPVCRLTNNNFLSDSFAVHKGVRQGDPLSPTLFVLCIECLASALRASSQYVGLQLGSSNVKISLFADDTIIYLNRTVNQFEIVSAIFTKFATFSGCTINWNKSKAFYIGASKRWQKKPLSHFGLQWPDDNIQYLGLTIPTKPKGNKYELFRLNFDGYCPKLQTILNLWKSRGLTLLGKITILKCLVFPKLLFKLSMIPSHIFPPFLRSLNQIVYSFIWGSKWERISRVNLTSSVELGGANMLHLPAFITALHWKFMQAFLNDSAAPLSKDVEKSCVSDCILQCVLSSNLTLQHRLLRKLIPFRFLKMGIQAAKTLIPYNTEENKFLWLNKNVKYKRNPLIISKFINAGICFHAQLLDGNGNYMRFSDLACKFSINSNSQTNKDYVTLYLAVPETWENRASSTLIYNTNVDFLNIVKQKSLDSWVSTKNVYLHLTGNHEGPIKHQIRWLNDLSIDSRAINWRTIYCNNYFCTTETKLRSFQIKLDLRAIVTNVQLHGFGIVDSPFCSFCAQSIETILHLFCFCPVVDQFWYEVFSWICCHFKRDINFCNFNKIFGFQELENCTKTDLINCFLLNARFLIYRCKIEKTKPNIMLFISTINLQKKTEYLIAKRNGDLKKHFRKWNIY